MPGLMTTFVDVGLNDRLAEALSAGETGVRMGPPDGIADSCNPGPCRTEWPVTCSTIMNDFKNRHGIERKSELLGTAHARWPTPQEPGFFWE